MTRPAYYNEIDTFCCDVLRARIADGSLPPGDVDERDIRLLNPNDLSNYGQVHLFAGIGGGGLACRLAGVPDDFRIITAGVPCQPASQAGKRLGSDDERWLWPEAIAFLRALGQHVALLENPTGILAERKESPSAEQRHAVADWYGAHWSLADADRGRREWLGLAEPNGVEGARGREFDRCGEVRELDDSAPTADANGSRSPHLRQGEAGRAIGSGNGRRHAFGAGGLAGQAAAEWWATEPDVGRVAHGVPARVDRLRALGNAWVPQAAVPALRVILARYAEAVA